MDVLHLVGATSTRFYLELSQTYHRHCVQPAGTRSRVLTVHPDGRLTWDAGLDARPVGLGQALNLAARCDVCVPHMFCVPGMTTWRGVIEDVAGVPVVGPPLASTAVTTSKWQTKAAARTAGVTVPEAVRLAPGDPRPTPALPCIVKPDAEDNSLGLTLVREAGQLDAALDTAFRHGATALVETYVPGRELRVGVLDEGDGPRLLPVLEYHVTPDRPIRVRSDKVDVDAGGGVTEQSWRNPSLPTTCPAEIDAPLREALTRMALTMHEVTGGRDYSLYDVRVAPDGTPHLLEACTFWTFSRLSVVTRMIQAEGRDLEDVALTLWGNAAARRPVPAVAAE